MKKHVLVTEKLWKKLKKMTEDHMKKTGHRRSIGEQVEILIEENARKYEGQ